VSSVNERWGSRLRAVGRLSEGSTRDVQFEAHERQLGAKGLAGDRREVVTGEGEQVVERVDLVGALGHRLDGLHGRRRVGAR